MGNRAYRGSGEGESTDHLVLTEPAGLLFRGPIEEGSPYHMVYYIGQQCGKGLHEPGRIRFPEFIQPVPGDEIDLFSSPPEVHIGREGLSYLPLIT